MGCCSSREVRPETTERDVPLPTDSNGRNSASNNAAYNRGVLAPSAGNTFSPSSSRAPLTSNTAADSPRQSSTRPRPSSHQTDALSEHYNLPLTRPKSWKSKSRTWTVSQLRQERREFFDTRVTGQKEVWEALRQVTECVREADLATAQGLLDAVDCTLPSGRLEDGVYDQRGNLYRLPEQIISDPRNMVVDVNDPVGISPEIESKDEFSPSDKDETGSEIKPVVDKGKAAIEPDAFKLKCRLTDRGSDVYVLIGRSQKVEVLISRVKREAGVSSKVKIFYLGKELQKSKSLEEQDFNEAHVIQVFVCD